MSGSLPHLCVCICTFRRPELLRRLLGELRSQLTDNRFTYSVVVADNDREETARQVVSGIASDAPYKIVYCVEPVQNIALVRNRAVAHASGEFIVFIDDDEFPEQDWLLRLFEVFEQHGVDGVLGPVLPHYGEEVPKWFQKAGFYDFRKRHETGFKMAWRECRTGNVLFHRRVLKELEGPFREEFRTGGEDQDFFRRAIEKGRVFAWCDEAITYEVILPSRWNRRVLLSRALLRGKNTFRHHKHRLRNLLKSIIAVGAYALALPVLLIAGHHYFMKYLVKLADHIGRLLAFLGLNPVNERQM